MDCAAGLEHEHDPGLDAQCVGHLCDRNLGAEQRCDGGCAADVGDCGVRREQHISAAVGATAVIAATVVAALPPTYASLAANRTSPQPVGTTVTFSAGASGGASPYSYKWLVKQNGAWTVVQDWSTSTTLAWTPNVSGTYAIGIWARSNGVTADAPQTSAIAEFVVSSTSTPPPSTPPPSTPPPTSPPPSPSLPSINASLAANRTSPQPAGTTVTFSASASGGASPYSYKWLGEAERRRMDCAAGLEHEHDPGLDAKRVGHLRDRDLGAEQRCDGGCAADIGDCGVRRERHHSTPPLSPPPPPPPSMVNPPTSAVIGVDRPGPQPAGTALTFSASASGGASPYSYKWWVKQNGGAWTVLRDWSTSTSLTLTPTTSGTYVIGIWARSNGVTADIPQTSAILEFSVRSRSGVPGSDRCIDLREPDTATAQIPRQSSLRPRIAGAARAPASFLDRVRRIGGADPSFVASSARESSDTSVAVPLPAARWAPSQAALGSRCCRCCARAHPSARPACSGEST